MIRYFGDDRPAHMQDPGSGCDLNAEQREYERRQKARIDKDPFVRTRQILQDMARNFPDPNNHSAFSSIYFRDPKAEERILIHTIAQLKTAISTLEDTSGYKKILKSIQRTQPKFRNWDRHSSEKSRQEKRVLMREACDISGHPFKEPKVEPEYDDWF